jgi:hypothetical protein
VASFAALLCQPLLRISKRWWSELAGITGSDQHPTGEARESIYAYSVHSATSRNHLRLAMVQCRQTAHETLHCCCTADPDGNPIADVRVTPCPGGGFCDDKDDFACCDARQAVFINYETGEHSR